jgi:hypothetical protein
MGPIINSKYPVLAAAGAAAAGTAAGAGTYNVVIL